MTSSKSSRRALGAGIGIAVVTTALCGVVVAFGAPWTQWLAIASLVLLGEGVLLAGLSYRGPRVPRTRISLPMTPHAAYVFEEGWRRQPPTRGRLSRHWLWTALPPLVLGAILFVLTAAL